MARPRAAGGSQHHAGGRRRGAGRGRGPVVPPTPVGGEGGGVGDGAGAQAAAIAQLITPPPSAPFFPPRHCIRLGENARLTLLEISAGQGAYLLNTVAEIHVADGAAL